MPRPLNALIIDDSPTTRRMIMRTLEQAGLAEFIFTEADDGIDAFDKFRPDETQIIFVDMNMPKMDGLEFMRTLRAQHKKRPPTVMITGEADQERLREAITKAGVDAFLLKPVDRDRLQAGLRKLVDSIPERSGGPVVPHGDCVPRALRNVLKASCELEITSEPADESVRRGKIVLGMIALHGDVHWSVGVGFTRESAAAIASKFAGYEIPAGSPDLGDAIGEIANIVGGGVKQLLSVKGLSADLSLPAVLAASEFEVLLQHKSATDYAHFDSSLGKLWSMVTVGVDIGMIL